MDWMTVAERLGIGFAVALFMLISGGALIRWMFKWLTSQLATGQVTLADVVKTQQAVIVNHLDHSVRAEEKMAAAVGKLAEAVDRQTEVIRWLGTKTDQK
jgi:hypothetical protein